MSLGEDEEVVEHVDVIIRHHHEGNQLCQFELFNEHFMVTFKGKFH